MPRRHVSLRLLDPALLFSVVWILVLGTWWFLPSDEFARLTTSARYVSGSAIAFFLCAVLVFLVGTVLGSRMFRTTERPAQCSIPDLDRHDLRLIRRGLLVVFTIGGAAASYLLVAGTIRAGGITGLADYVINGGTWSRIATYYFEPVRRAGITSWLHLLAAIAPLAIIGMALSDDRRIRRNFQVVFALGFVLAIAISAAFAERLIAFGFVVGALVAWIGVNALRPRATQGNLRSVVVRTALVVGLLGVMWFGSEFSRTYLATRATDGPIGAADVESSTPLAAKRFLAYMAASTNNGMYAVDKFEPRLIAESSLSVVLTSIGFDTGTSPFAGDAADDLDTLLGELYPYHNPLTTFSLPGFAFMDLGWGSLIVIFWLGAAAGAVYSRFVAGELWAVLVYPLIAIGILDSYRIMYWTRTEMVIPLIGLAFVAAQVYGRRKRSSMELLRT